MAGPGATSKRKVDHVRINLEKDVTSSATTNLEHYRFEPRALPELDLAEVDLSGKFLGLRFRAPLLISSMTGGSDSLSSINERLAQAAQLRGIAMGVGSQRAALESDSVAASFKVRHLAPDIPLFANLGAVQLNYGYGIDECRRAVEMIGADALVLHLNALQEALQPEGDTRFAGLLGRIESIASLLEVPLIAKEVGWGISAHDARRLADAGVAAIDVAGAGGTSWSEIESHRAQSEVQRLTAAAFVSWGIPTADSILAVRQVAPEVELVASGGLRTGLDAAKSLALGATLAGMASPFLKAAAESTEAVVEQIDALSNTIRIVMFATGAANLAALRAAATLLDTRTNGGA